MSGKRSRADSLSAAVPVFELEPGCLLTVKELAVILGLTTKGVYSMVEGRRIPFIKVSNRVRFLRADVIAWLKENRVVSQEQSQ